MREVGIVVFAHGSRLEPANEAVRRVARQLAQLGQFAFAEAAFLDCTAPDLRTTVEQLVQRGVERVIVLPYFLTEGRHTMHDLPQLVEKIRETFPGVEIDVADTLDGHPGILQALLDRVRSRLDRGA